MIAHVTLSGAQLLGVGVLGLVSGWLAADLMRGR